MPLSVLAYRHKGSAVAARVGATLNYIIGSTRTDTGTDALAVFVANHSMSAGQVAVSSSSVEFEGDAFTRQAFAQICAGAPQTAKRVEFWLLANPTVVASGNITIHVLATTCSHAVALSLTGGSSIAMVASTAILTARAAVVPATQDNNWISFHFSDNDDTISSAKSGSMMLNLMRQGSTADHFTTELAAFQTAGNVAVQFDGVNGNSLSLAVNLSGASDTPPSLFIPTYVSGTVGASAGNMSFRHRTYSNAHMLAVMMTWNKPISASSVTWSGDLMTRQEVTFSGSAHSELWTLANATVQTSGRVVIQAQATVASTQLFFAGANFNNVAAFVESTVIGLNGALDQAASAREAHAIFAVGIGATAGSNQGAPAGLIARADAQSNSVGHQYGIYTIVTAGTFRATVSANNKITNQMVFNLRASSVGEAPPAEGDVVLVGYRLLLGVGI